MPAQRVRVYRVENSVGADFIARSFDEVVAFLTNECNPERVSDPETGNGGAIATITAEDWAPEQIARTGEWEP